MLLKLLHKIEREGMLLNSFYKANIILIPKSSKEIKIYKPITFKNVDAKILKLGLEVSGRVGAKP
jgi:hypothetical protein